MKKIFYAIGLILLAIYGWLLISSSLERKQQEQQQAEQTQKEFLRLLHTITEKPLDEININELLEMPEYKRNLLMEVLISRLNSDREALEFSIKRRELATSLLEKSNLLPPNLIKQLGETEQDSMGQELKEILDGPYSTDPEDEVDTPEEEPIDQSMDAGTRDGMHDPDDE